MIDSGQDVPKIAIVTALPKEHAAVSRLLRGSEPCIIEEDPTLYRLGVIPGSVGQHQVILACLTKYGNNTAAITATNIHRSFPSVSTVILIGICAGIPRPQKPSAHVRLGDVIISSGSGVVQFDIGMKSQDGFQYRGSAPPPSAKLLQAVNALESAMIVEPGLWADAIHYFLAQANVTRPHKEPPHPDFRHPADKLRSTGVPRIFKGSIGASNSLMKDRKERDEVAERHGLLGLEMEGSGIADAMWDSNLQYLIVRGVCDYADANKDDSWQEYASHVAAAYLQLLLLTLPGNIPDTTTQQQSSVPVIEPTGEIRSRLFNLANQGSLAPASIASSNRPLSKSKSAYSRLGPIPVTTQRLTAVAWLKRDLLACGGFDGHLYWVDPWTSACATINLTRTKIRAIEPLDDRNLLVSDDGGSIWLIRSLGEDAVELCRNRSPIYDVSVVKGTLKFYTAARSGDIDLWEIRDLDELRPRALSVRTVDRHDAPSFGLSSSTSGCVSVAADGQIHELQLGRAGVLRKSLASVALFSVATEPEFALTVVGDAAGSLYLLEQDQVNEVQLHADAIRSLALRFPWVLSYSKDGTAKAFNCRTGLTSVIYEGNDYGYSVRLAPDSSAAALVHGSGELVTIYFGKPLWTVTGEEMDLLSASAEQQ